MRTKAQLQLAMHGEPPLSPTELATFGWSITDALSELRSVADYRRYIARSRGEWAVAKNCYVATRSGWIGDRSPAYLATGRLVVLQATGYEKYLPTGTGLLSFADVDEAAAAIDDVES